ncbi:MAG TPA: hypothetical protein VMT27_07775 [Actinomycetes bacterium]|nr:hypothetical protein [Actinomycetes bacterium]
MSNLDRCQRQGCGHYRGNHTAEGCRSCEGCTAFVDGLPELPYAGTSGWSGSDTSRERAESDDSSGVTTARQRETLRRVSAARFFGMTWKDLADSEGWHHGQASGALSVLHKQGRLARLRERRDRCEIYVIPDFVDGRELSPHRPNSHKAALTDAEQAVVERARSHSAEPVVAQLLALIDRIVE